MLDLDAIVAFDRKYRYSETVTISVDVCVLDASYIYLYHLFFFSWLCNGLNSAGLLPRLSRGCCCILLRLTAA